MITKEDRSYNIIIQTRIQEMIAIDIFWKYWYIQLVSQEKKLNKFILSY